MWWCSRRSSRGLLAVFSTLIVSSIGQDILEYNEGSSSRIETGQPGDSVKGRYSWVDAGGQRHDVWYEADKMGFRAFGDVHPGSTTFGDGTGHKDVLALLGTPVIIIGTSAVNDSPVETSNMRNSKKIEVNISDIVSDVQLTTENSSHGFSLSGLNVQPSKSDSVAGVKNSLSGNAKNSSNIPVPKTNINLANKSLHSTLNNLSKDKTHTLDRGSLGLLSIASKLEKNNKNLNNINDKNTFKSSNVHNNQQLVLNEKTIAENITFPRLIAGSRFILVDHKMLPNQQKLRIGSFPLMPQPVPTTGKETPVIMGLHSSGNKAGLPKNLMPIALMLQQTFMNKHPPSTSNQPQTKVPNNGPTPRPRKVTGKLNFDNFFRPALTHRTTPKPFQLPQPSKEHDYQYADYYYYDYVDTSGTSGGPLVKINPDIVKINPDISQSKSNQRKNISNKSEEDLDFSDSYEEND